MRRFSILLGSVAGIFILILLLSTPIMGLFNLGTILSPGGIYGAAYDSIHRSQTLTVEGLSDTVTIIRDEWGIPHIYGKTREDVSFALGYVHGVDRLFQMEMTSRTGMGRMAEILGESSLADDIWYLRVGVLRAAEEMLETYERERSQDPILDRTLKLLDSYCDGVNTVIKERIKSKNLPLEFYILGFEPSEWRPLKSLVINRLMSLMLTFQTYDLHATLLRDRLFGGSEALMEELFPLNQSIYQMPVVPTYGKYDSPTSETERSVVQRHGNGVSKSVLIEVLNDVPESFSISHKHLIGSNNWVAGGSKTTTGKPILANDMHLSITLPHIWYEAHLVAHEDDLNVYGYTLAGVPVVVVGYNTHVAWGFTNVGNDAVDWYDYVWESGKYLSGKEGGWKEPIEVEVTIPVKGRDDHVEAMKFTEDGVLMTEMDVTLAMKWAATEAPTYEIKAFYGINVARNWQEFNESMQYFMDPTQNVVFADADGNIALRPTGRFIKRNYFGEGRFILNGSDPNLDKEWEFLSYKELPLSLNPPQGYLASANQKTAGPEYPFYISSTQAPGYRGRSINRLLDDAPSHSIDIEFMMDAQCGDGGIYDICAESFTPYFVAAIENSGLVISGSFEEQAFNTLKEWQSNPELCYKMRKDLIGPTIFYATMNRFKEYTWQDEYISVGVSGLQTPQDNILEYLVRNNPDSKWFDDITTIEIEDRDDIISRAFQQAIMDLQEELGSDVLDWVWGSYHKIYMEHLTQIPTLGLGPFSHDGSRYTLMVAGGRVVRHGPSQRMIVDFSDPSNCWSVLPTGASGIHSSLHYDDQMELWLNGSYHPMFIEGTVNDFPSTHLESTLILMPTQSGG